ncbi:flagellar filament capping protein FliD [Paenibacillus sp. YAF4_2]|uniref:flagellar filament capping protein FliD n=1 Tax=Paenibacillus sp. YAF4_2 TaxID=3233085 RepID=UPI003F95EC02
MSTLRVTGLASGIDYESMITKLMDAQRVPLDKLNQKKQINQWVQDDYRTLNNKILDFKNAAFDMKLQSGYLAKSATSSNDSIATVSGTANAIEGQYTLKVQQLAGAASLTSGKLTGTKLSDMGIATASKITIKGAKGSVDLDINPNDSFEQFAANFNSQSAATGVKVSYDSTLKTMFFSSTKTGADANIDLKGANLNQLFNLTGVSAQTITGSVDSLTAGTQLSGVTGTQTLTVNVGGVVHTFDVTSATKVGDLIDSMNSDLQSSEIKVSLDKDGKLSFANADSSKAITFAESDSGLLDSLGLDSPMVVTGNPAIHADGKNAIISFNGVQGEYDSNTFTVAGLSVTAKQESSTATTIGVTQDVDSVYNKIKTFVDKYNDLISTINSELSEDRYRDYTPLTDAQRKEMSDTQIEQWESKAKSGLLASDSLLTNSLYTMRQSLSSSVSGLASGQMKYLSDIGISSSLISGSSVSGNYQDNGKLYIDETKLKQMIADNPDEVTALFTSDDGNSKSSSGDGIATRLYNQASSVFSQIVDKAGASTSVRSTYVLGKESLELDDQISRLQTRLDDMETRYYNQFTAMETYISQMNSRSSSLASLLNSGG